MTAKLSNERPRPVIGSPAVLLAMMVLMASVAITGCELPFDFREDGSRDFVIRTGEHYASPRLMETFRSDRLAFRATFNESAQYDLGDPSLQTNKNKLMGFSDCGSAHHGNSARFAWQWYNNRLEIYAYCYVDSVRTERFIAAVNINEDNLYEIAATDTDYVFFLNGEKKETIARSRQCADGVNYVLYPYFGGSAPAPHDVRITIEKIK